jgi:hypothetical protein
VRPAPVAAWSTALALAGIAGLLVHLEMRASAAHAELIALHAELTALRGEPAEPRTASPSAPAPFPVRYVMDSDSIQAIARAVVQLQAKQAAAAAASAPGAEVPPLRSVDQEKALAHATDVLSQAIAHGRLSRDDVIRMRRDLETGRATDAERDALRSQVALAINAQKLSPEDPGFIYP